MPPYLSDMAVFFMSHTKTRQEWSLASVALREAYKERVQQEVINHYGVKCECCGEEHIEFLSIDYINGGGTQERKDNNKRGTNFYLYLRRMSFPVGYRVLCYNCNFSLGRYGRCPHKSKPGDHFRLSAE